MQIQALPAAPALHRSIEGYEGAIVESYAPMRVASATSGTGHRWAVEDAQCGDLRLTRIFAEGAIRAHIPRMNRTNCAGKMLLTYVEGGAFRFEQHGQRAECSAGSLVLMDATQPLAAAQDGVAALLSIVFPATRLRAEVPLLARRCTAPVTVKAGSRVLLRDLMQSVWRERAALAGDGASLLPRLFGRLIEDVFPDRGTGQRAPGEVYLPAARDLIREDLRNPALSPAYLAKRLGLSTSYLFALAREAGMSLHEEIMQVRLEAARDALCAPAWSTASVTDIALDFGFQDPAHFSRRFRARFGYPPSAIRRAAGTAPATDSC
ncbi:MAG: helix-turn-helix domain-containing protein [Gammaproteobacteria bacterium]|nr:helix-turn-helix domain-containing protein [Gammaproteobacteria bacterium]